jgi:hypothetical protein
MNYTARPGFPKDHATPQRGFTAWKAQIDARLARLWPGRCCDALGVDDVQLAWRWLEGQEPEDIARELVLERNAELLVA